MWYNVIKGGDKFVRTVHYIDYENVFDAGLSGIEKLPKNDKVIIFVGNSVDTVKIHVNTLADVLIKYVPVGKQDALDFQLLAHLFVSVVKHPKRFYNIISKDRSYDYAIHMLNTMGYLNVERYSSIGGSLSDAPVDTLASVGTVVKTSIEAPKSDKKPGKNDYKQDKLYRAIVGQGFSGIDKVRYMQIKSCFDKAANRQQFYEGLTHAMGAKKGRMYYSALKCVFDSLK